MSYQLNKTATITMTFNEHELTTLWLALDMKAHSDLEQFNHVFKNTQKLFDLIDQAINDLNKALDAE